MAGGIYLLRQGGELLELAQEDYDSESLLQLLLAKYPQLLAGDQIDRTVPRRWLLISREMAVPFEDGGSGRWSVDHLFVDQDGVPTIVEVKRSRDTRIRREVIGQMLDYAANAVVYWPVETIRARFEKTCASRNVDPVEALAEVLSPDREPEQFWQSVKTNLQAGRVRLVFVADSIPRELQRVVEFLNAQMDPAEVLAVEISQYVGGDTKALVPRVLGQTAEAQVKKSSATGAEQPWDETRFIGALTVRDPDAVPVTRAILDWAVGSGLRARWGSGVQMGSCFLFCDHREVPHFLLSLWTNGRAQVEFVTLKRRPAFASEEQRKAFLGRLKAIPGISLRDDIEKQPSFFLHELADRARLEQFTESLNWAVAEIRRS